MLRFLIFVCLAGIPLVFGSTIDSDCFDAIFEDTDQKTDRFFPDDTLVTVTHLHMSQTNFGTVQTTIRSVDKKLIAKGIRSVLTYRYPSPGGSPLDYNPRNLTLHFDGTAVFAAIGHLLDSYNGLTGNPPYTQEWLPCESGSTLTFHEYVSQRSTGQRTHTWEKLEVRMSPPNTPYGPSYDNDCSTIGGIPNKIEPVEKGINTRRVANVKHIRRVSTRQGTFDSVQSDRNVTVETNAPIVVSLNHTSASGDYGFDGAAVHPRNLTLWLNESTSLVATVAYLDQKHSFITDHAENTETWTCPTGLDKNGEIYFCSFTSFSTSGVYSMTADVFRIQLVDSDKSGATVTTGYISWLIVAFLLAVDF